MHKGHSRATELTPLTADEDAPDGDIDSRHMHNIGITLRSAARSL